jgi:hypothetical protein
MLIDFLVFNATFSNISAISWRPVLFFSLAAILVGSRDQRTQFWKGAIQGPFHQSLVAIGPVVSEEKIKFFCEIFLSADIYRLCKLGIF